MQRILRGNILSRGIRLPSAALQKPQRIHRNIPQSSILTKIRNRRLDGIRWNIPFNFRGITRLATMLTDGPATPATELNGLLYSDFHLTWYFIRNSSFYAPALTESYRSSQVERQWRNDPAAAKLNGSDRVIPQNLNKLIQLTVRYPMHNIVYLNAQYMCCTGPSP